MTWSHRQEAPEAAVPAVVPVVAHHEELPRGHRPAGPQSSRIASAAQAVLRVVGPQRCLEEVGVGLVEGRAVDQDLLVPDLDRLARAGRSRA